ncbi:Bax inhibitor-1/YccA family protein [Abyssalbus ytuae]|uniref:Bax inhibitor-1/YccA family protein n=1 Tax=Abyssalbus ytuae TaxID=2926907 RepID=A0A9E6ZRD4_9FLAO|nr:Bax inhibitor-1/YccA family protein [Abyssalbus ytuae]UOB19085.1 Bax inhibitor-1/YccA family protein [Abyssalbus ytuae]
MSIFGINTSNPAFTTYFWDKNSYHTFKKMTLGGIILKSFFGLILVTLTAVYTWHLYFKGVDVQWHLYGGMIAALIFSVIISYKHDKAKFFVPLYAIAKGFFLGAVSVFAHKKFPGLPFRAVAVTIVTFFVMLFLYRIRVIKVTRQFRSVIISVSVVIFTLYFINFILHFFNITFPFLWGTSWFAIGFNVITVIVASLSLMLDFDYIERYLGKAPKEKEWITTWGFLVTLIWLYIEVLRLMKKLAIRF